MIPFIIAFLGAVDLVSALIAVGMGNGVSWIAFCIPILLCAYFLLKPRRG